MPSMKIVCTLSGNPAEQNAGSRKQCSLTQCKSTNRLLHPQSGAASAESNLFATPGSVLFTQRNSRGVPAQQSALREEVNMTQSIAVLHMIEFLATVTFLVLIPTTKAVPLMTDARWTTVSAERTRTESQAHCLVE
jgi:hypothetical protein